MLIFRSLILTEQIQTQVFFTESQSQKHSTVTSLTQISITWSQN